MSNFTRTGKRKKTGVQALRLYLSPRTDLLTMSNFTRTGQRKKTGLQGLRLYRYCTRTVLFKFSEIYYIKY